MQPPLAAQDPLMDWPSALVVPVTVMTEPYQAADIRLTCPFVTVPVRATSGAPLNEQLLVGVSKGRKSAESCVPLTIRLPARNGGTDTRVLALPVRETLNVQLPLRGTDVDAGGSFMTTPPQPVKTRERKQPTAIQLLERTRPLLSGGESIIVTGRWWNNPARVQSRVPFWREGNYAFDYLLMTVFRLVFP